MIRTATPQDVPVIVAMIRELALYEKAEHEVEATEEHIHRALFCDAPAVFAHIAETEGRPEGFAMWFLNFSTWRGAHGIYLEDLYVRPEARRRGHGRALLGELARVCVERGYRRLDWSVLDWNMPAVEFYRSLGAEPMAEWTGQRLTGDALVALAAPAAEAQPPRGA
jgi:GNAT superfamily N-acetyltransferase